MTDHILIAGDTHGDMTHVITLLDNAASKGCSRVVVVGDFGAWEHMAEGRQFFDDVNRHARNRLIPVYFIDGNHDKTSLVEQMYAANQTWDGFYTCREFLYYIPRGHVWQWGVNTFAAFGGAYSVDKPWRLAQELHDRERYGTNTSGTLWFREEEMTDADMDAHLQRITGEHPDGVNVMLTHDKPRASRPGWNRKDLPECWPNQDRIQRAVTELRPARLYHGHLHWRYTDRIRCGDDMWTTVEGLNCNPVAAEGGNQERLQSWLTMDVDEYVVNV